MSNLLLRRLAALEAWPSLGEMPATPEGMQRIGRCLFVPIPLPPSEWERMARESQAALTERERSA